MSNDTQARYRALTQHTQEQQPEAPQRTIPPTPPARPSHTLPQQSTSFVGRENELSVILEQLSDRDCRLLTLLGMGGIGKTRLALSVAEQLEGVLKHGVFFVSLASLATPNDIVTAIASALHFRFGSKDSEMQQLLSYLRRRELLLLLDNFEHLLDGVPIVDSLLSSTSDVKILATSREPLDLGWECLFEVRGLSVPATTKTSDAEAYSGVRLFVERATRTQPTFKLDNVRSAVIQICQRVGGAPLGIEIAAGWLRLMPPDEIASRLLDLETARRDLPARQRSLRTLLDETWLRLSPEEQQIMAQLSVFQGSFTHGAVESVTGAPSSIVTSLVNRSLVQYDHATHRLQLHELVREYADERMNRSGEARLNTLDRHAEFYTKLIEHEQEPIAMGHADHVAPEIENIRAAWEWALERRNAPALYRAVRSMLQTFQSNFHSDIVLASGSLQGNRSMFERAAEVLQDLPESRERDLALGQCLVAVAAGTRGPERQQFYAEGLSLLRRHGPSIELAYANLWVTSSSGGRFPIEENLKESLAIYTELGSKWGVSVCLLNMIFSRLAHKQVTWIDSDTLMQLSEKCQHAMMLAREIGSDVNMIWALARMSWIEDARGNFQGALEYTQQAISLSWKNGYAILAAQHQINLVNFAIALEEYELAESVAEETYTLLEDLGAPFFRLHALITLGKSKYCRGKYDDARQCLETVLAQDEALNRPMEITTLISLGFVALAQAQIGEAWHHFVSALELVIDQAPDLFGLPEAILGVGYTCFQQRDIETALNVLGVVVHCRIDVVLARDAAKFRDQLETECDPVWVAKAIERGKNRNLLDVARELLTAKPSSVALKPPTATPIQEFLTERELEVLNLIAAGKSNRQIADELYIAVGTVKTHVHNLRDKLHAKNRTEAVAIARDAGLLQ